MRTNQQSDQPNKLWSITRLGLLIITITAAQGCGDSGPKLPPEQTFKACEERLFVLKSSVFETRWDFGEELSKADLEEVLKNVANHQEKRSQGEHQEAMKCPSGTKYFFADFRGFTGKENPPKCLAYCPQHNLAVLQNEGYEVVKIDPEAKVQSGLTDVSSEYNRQAKKIEIKSHPADKSSSSPVVKSKSKTDEDIISQFLGSRWPGCTIRSIDKGYAGGAIMSLVEMRDGTLETFTFWIKNGRVEKFDIAVK